MRWGMILGWSWGAGSARGRAPNESFKKIESELSENGVPSADCGAHRNPKGVPNFYVLNIKNALGCQTRSLRGVLEKAGKNIGKWVGKL